MRILVTGNRGYVGALLTPKLLERGHEVVGLDSDLFRGCDFGAYEPLDHPQISADVRDVVPSQLRGFDAVVHLAGISNDPLGNLDPGTTYDINHRASVRLARLAKAAGVRRFVFASSCSTYGAAGDDTLDESAPWNPVTPYGRSKVLAERDLSALSDRDFSPTFVRGATAFGVSPRLRADLVVNNLVGYAVTTGEVLLKSDGMAWRPLVHVADLARAYVGVVEAPRRSVHGEAFNVGSDRENHRVRDVAERVAEAIPEARIEFTSDAGPDIRSYRVSFAKLSSLLPNHVARWSLESGIRQLADHYRALSITEDQFLSSRWLRIQRVRELLAEGLLSRSLRWQSADRGAQALTQA